VVLPPRKGSAAVCARCHVPAPGYDQLAERRFEFIPLWGFFVFLRYAMRRVDCRRCGMVAVEKVPWGDGKRTLTKAYLLFLARWARRLSWKETAECLRTSWDKLFDAVEHVVTWGLDHRMLGQIDASGVGEIQYAKGHQYLTLVFPMDIGITRLLWVGRERTIESFQGCFATMDQEVISIISFICSDMLGALFKGHQGEVLRGPAYPRPVPHRRQNEQGPRRGPRRGNPPHETRGARPGAKAVPLAAAETQPEPR
jgi:transposase